MNSSNTIDALLQVVGPAGLTQDKHIIEPYLKDWVGYTQGHTPVMVSPSSTEEVSSIMGVCANYGAAIVPQGGNTSSVAGGVPHGEILLSLRRMNQIRNIDPADFTITVDAGCILANVQSAALKVDRFFPLSIGSEGSCTIGGNVSTNAGGISVLRYGNMRDLVLGLEVVLPDGRIWDGLRRLRKDNSGYAIKHIFIGAEGSLGVITGVSLRLFPQPLETATAFVALHDLDSCLSLLSVIRETSGDAVSSYELIPRLGLDIALKYDSQVIDPITRRHEWYALIEFSGTRADGSTIQALETSLSEALQRHLINDAVVANSGAQADALWRIRRSIVEFQPQAGGEIKHDVSVPISKVPDFIRRAGISVNKVVQDIRPVAYGHIGDGNIHYNLSPPLGMTRASFLKYTNQLHSAVYDVVADFDGSFAAEHGVGIVKKDELVRYRSDTEVDLMRQIKHLIDPEGLMNPGKVLHQED